MQSPGSKRAGQQQPAAAAGGAHAHSNGHAAAAAHAAAEGAQQHSQQQGGDARSEGVLSGRGSAGDSGKAVTSPAGAGTPGERLLCPANCRARLLVRKHRMHVSTWADITAAGGCCVSGHPWAL